MNNADVSVIEANLAAFAALPLMDIGAIKFNLQTYEEMRANSVVIVTAPAKNPSALERETPHDPRLGVVSKMGTCEQCSLDAASCSNTHVGLIEFHTYLPPPEKDMSMILKLLISIFCAGCGRPILSDDMLRNIRKRMEESRREMGGSDWHYALLVEIAENSNGLCHNRTNVAEHANGIAYSLLPKTDPFSSPPYVEGATARGKSAPVVRYPLEYYYAAMERLTMEQLYYLGYADYVEDSLVRRAHPKALIVRAMPVTSLSCRAPVIDANSDNTNFHPITKAYNKVIEAANGVHAAELSLRDTLAKKQNGHSVSDELITKHRNALQVKINQLNLVFIENYETIQKSILSNKTSGLMRGESQGKVTSQVARTIIVPDPTLRAGEVSIPQDAASRITTIVRVTQGNIVELTRKLREGRIKYIHPHTSIIQNTSIQVTESNRGSLIIQIDDSVSRDIEVGDSLLFIRQPVISGLSLISNRVKKIWNELAFGFSLEEVEIRAADFDGDAAQGLAPQSEEAMSELKSINSAEQLLINAKDQALVFGIHQDAVLGSVVMTTNPLREGDVVTEDKGYVSMALFERITALTSQQCKDDISEEGRSAGIPDKLTDFKRRLEKWGKTFSVFHDGQAVVPSDVLLSWAFPADIQYTADTVEIRDGIIYRGIVDKKVMGRTQDTLLHSISEQGPRGRENAITLMKDLTVIATSFLSFFGVSAGWRDCAPVKEASQKVIGMELARMMRRLDDLETPTDARDVGRYEGELRSVIEKSTGIINAAIMDGLDPDNRIMRIIKSGAKGEARHLYSIAGIIGQQYVAGKLPKRVMTGGTRYSWYFDADDREPTNMGMCTSSLSHGMSPAELVHVASAARISFTNLNIMTPDIGNRLNATNRVLAGVITTESGACVDNQNIVQSLYGGDGFAADRLSRVRQPTGKLELRFARLGQFLEQKMAEEGYYRM